MASETVEKMEEPQNTTEGAVPEDAVTSSDGDNGAGNAPEPAAENDSAPVAADAEGVADAAAPVADASVEDEAPVEDANDGTEDDNAQASEPVEVSEAEPVANEDGNAAVEATPESGATLADAEPVEVSEAEPVANEDGNAAVEATPESGATLADAEPVEVSEAEPVANEDGNAAVVAETTPESDVMTADAEPDHGEESEPEPEGTPVTAAPANFEAVRVKQAIAGSIAKVTLAGAIVDLGIDVPGFLHISQLSDQRVKNVTDVVNEGDKLTVYVMDVDRAKKRISLTLLKPPALLWSELVGMVNKSVEGTVVRIEKFGAFVDIGAERPGLIHVSELADEYVGSPESVVNVDDEITVRVIGVNVAKKQVDLSLKAMHTEIIEDDDEDEDEPMTAMELAMRRAMNREKKKARRGKSGGRRNEQAEIIARTLQSQRDNN